MSRHSVQNFHQEVEIKPIGWGGGLCKSDIGGNIIGIRSGFMKLIKSAVPSFNFTASQESTARRHTPHVSVQLHTAGFPDGKFSLRVSRFRNQGLRVRLRMSRRGRGISNASGLGLKSCMATRFIEEVVFRQEVSTVAQLWSIYSSTSSRAQSHKAS